MSLTCLKVKCFVLLCFDFDDSKGGSGSSVSFDVTLCSFEDHLFLDLIPCSQ